MLTTDYPLALRSLAPERASPERAKETEPAGANRDSARSAILRRFHTRKAAPMASPAIDYARANQQRFLNELKDLLRIPSISTLEEHKSDVQKAAEFVADDLRRIGLEH